MSDGHATLSNIEINSDSKLQMTEGLEEERNILNDLTHVSFTYEGEALRRERHTIQSLAVNLASVTRERDKLLEVQKNYGILLEKYQLVKKELDEACFCKYEVIKLRTELYAEKKELQKLRMNRGQTTPTSKEKRKSLFQNNSIELQAKSYVELMDELSAITKDRNRLKSEVEATRKQRDILLQRVSEDLTTTAALADVEAAAADTYNDTTTSDRRQIPEASPIQSKLKSTQPLSTTPKSQTTISTRNPTSSASASASASTAFQKTKSHPATQKV